VELAAAGYTRWQPALVARDPRRITSTFEGANVLLILGIILLVIAIAGGVIVHPVLFALAIVALVLFFVGR
jgi:hypothetical protein